MPSEHNTPQDRVLASLILRIFDELGAPRGAALKALDYCRNHLEDRSKVEGAALASGYGTTDFCWTKDLEVYYEIIRNSDNVSYLAKGWDDTGFWLGETVVVPQATVDELHGIRKRCAENGVVVSVKDNGVSDCEISLEYHIDSADLDGRALVRAVSSLVECSANVRTLLS